MTNFSSATERRRLDWQQNDRRRHFPWVVDINDRRSGLDRRVEADRRLEAERQSQTARLEMAQSEVRT